MKENNPREIPTKKIPDEYQPEKAPQIPDTEPSKNNSLNPKENKLSKKDILNT